MLSSNTLFHYTHSRDTLLSILRQTFKPNFSLETAPFDQAGTVPQNGTPMVCFCDIPLSAATDHMGRYGQYAIGLTKEWATSNGISPVLYTHSQSPISTGLKRLMDQGLRVGKESVDTHLWDEVVRILSFVKPYEDTELDGRYDRLYRFYDEREWRWVPQALPEELKYGIEASQFVNGKPSVEESDRLHAACQLEFNPNDIRYIVVANEDEIVPTVRDILRIKERFSEDEKLLLTTRVISAEHIRSDF